VHVVIDIQRCLIEAVYSLESRDQASLFHCKVGEQAVVAQIGWALRSLVPPRVVEAAGWDVDLEYDRQDTEGDLKQRKVRLGRPDLVVHRRGLRGPRNNLLIVEVKRTYGSMKRLSSDQIKVNEFIERHGYQFGATVSLGPRVGQFEPRFLGRGAAAADWELLGVTRRVSWKESSA
jgi:hypothetical protein